MRLIAPSLREDGWPRILQTVVPSAAILGVKGFR
jgi:hypothetical protein